MGRPKSKGAYVPLAAQYYLDDAILEAGPDAELLFVRMLSFLAAVPSDGFITDRQVKIVAAGLRAPARRLDSLLNVGLIEQVSGGFLVRSWLKWNRSADEVGKLLAKDRERKARKDAADAPNSERNPLGFQTDSELQSSTEQSSTEQNPPTGGSARTRGTRIPDPFIVTGEMRKWAAERTPNVNVNLSTEKFVNFWRAKSGRDATKRDWPATWRNWLLTDQEKAGAPRSFVERREEQALSLVEQLEQMEREEAGRAGIGSGEAVDVRRVG